MILADKIINERKKNGWSQEELAARLSVSRQSVSKWEGAQSVPDLQRIIQMADLFGVTTDYLLKDEIEEIVDRVPQIEAEQASNLRRVSMEEAYDFLELKRVNASKIADSVALCILSPAILIALAGLAEGKIGFMTESLAAGIGLVVLFGFIAFAVYRFITCGIQEQYFAYLEEENFETEYGVSGMVKEKQMLYMPVYIRAIATGVVFCILAAIPLVIAGVADAPDYVAAMMVAVLLLLVAIGVDSIVRVCIIKDSYDTLLQEGDFTNREKQMKKKLDAWSSAYWGITTAIYLGWSLWTMRWEFTWIVWPVAAVLFAAVSAILRSIIKVES